MVRSLTPTDLPWVLELNKAFEVELSPLNEQTLAQLVVDSWSALVADPAAAFLIALDETADYLSPNYLWFRARYSRFLYVDRIAVSGDHRRKGHANALYDRLLEDARAEGIEFVCCEVNSDPPNHASDAFHSAYGFEPVGEQFLEDRGKSVRYLGRHL